MSNTPNSDESESTDSERTTEEQPTATKTPEESPDDAGFTRRAAMTLAGVAGAGLLAGGAGQASASGKPRGRPWNRDVNARGHALKDLGALEMSDSEPITDFAGENLSIDDGALQVGDEVINNVRYVDVADGAAAVQEAVDTADAESHNKVVIYGDEGEWNEPVYLPSDFTLEIRDGVTITSSIRDEDANPFEVGDGTVGAALITNKDHENGNQNITIRGGFIDFAGVPDTDVVWAPVWLHNCDDSLFDSIRVENVAGPYGVMFSDCRDSAMIDCVGRNIGYDGIAIRLDCRHVDVYRCEAYECGGPGIQAATFGRGAGAPHDVNFINCRTDEMICFHGYPGPGGAQNVSVQGCFAGRIGMIGEVKDFRITGCNVNSVALSALGDTIQNGQIDGVTFGERTDEFPGTTATILWAFEGGLIENISFSDCTAQGLNSFVECRMPAESATARYLEYTDTAFDGDGVDGERAFIQNETVGGFSNVRMHGCNVWNAETAISGAVDGLRVRLSEFHGVDELDDGSVMDLETHQNDWW